MYKNTASSKPLFFIGSTPSQAGTIVAQDTDTAGVMVSMVALRGRVSDFKVGTWVLDSGAFTQIARRGAFEQSPEEYIQQIKRWSRCGELLTAVSQDYMCEPFVLARTGLSVGEHQQLTVERYHQLVSLAAGIGLQTPIMPVLQGFSIPDYLACLQLYGNTLTIGQWVGVGSVCRRNGNPSEIANILRSIKLLRPDLRLHGFGLKQLALENETVRDLLYSCDSMAWSYPARFEPTHPPLQEMATSYQQRIDQIINGQYQRHVPKTAGAGNNQGRKAKWNSETVAIRIPKRFAAQLVAIAYEWDSAAVDDCVQNQVTAVSKLSPKEVNE